MFENNLKPFLEGTCTIQLHSDSSHAPIFGCRLRIEDEKLLISPQVLFDELEDELLLINLEILKSNDLESITLHHKNHPVLRSIFILKEKTTSL